MMTLNAKREFVTCLGARLAKVTLYNQDGTVKAVYPPDQSKPRYGQNRVRLNGFDYLLHWIG